MDAWPASIFLGGNAAVPYNRRWFAAHEAVKPNDMKIRWTPGARRHSKDLAMKFSSLKFVKTLVITVFIGLIVAAVLNSLGFINLRGEEETEPEKLIREATQNLEAVRQRKPGERRPASYDSVMAPLDKLLQQTRKLIEGETFNPINDFEQVRALTLPIIDIATEADRQARTETGLLAKEYRFNAQKGEACQYLANVMWERINLRLPPQTGFLSEGTRYPAVEMTELRRILDTGIEASPQNGQLYYIRGVVNRADGLFAAAARDLERSVDIDHENVGAWNTLGLVQISLKEFAKAEDSYERAKALILDRANRFKQDPGEEYTAILYNLATFHEGLAAHYSRENRINPTVESQRLLAKHTADARRYLQEFLTREPSGTQDAKTAMAKLQGLPR